ncbi:MAG: hypothetical protein HQL03_11920 [Nitrospirae bacterium]|nr:hypothetical protein [Nitrospirota bacterium]
MKCEQYIMGSRGLLYGWGGYDPLRQHRASPLPLQVGLRGPGASWSGKEPGASWSGKEPGASWSGKEPAPPPFILVPEAPLRVRSC